MGKMKEQKLELMSSFSRMNFLFQAAIIASKTVPDTILSNYYGRLMKEVSKKVVEKVHPDIKRALCSSCSYPLFTNLNNASVKIKPHKKKKRKKKEPRDEPMRMIKKKDPNHGIIKSSSNIELHRQKKDLKPNKVLWSCNKCGFTKSFLQRPSHSLWIDVFQEEEKDRNSTVR